MLALLFVTGACVAFVSQSNQGGSEVLELPQPQAIAMAKPLASNTTEIKATYPMDGEGLVYQFNGAYIASLVDLYGAAIQHK